MAPHRIYAASFDGQRLRWQIPEVEVPTNPHTGGPFLFVPEKFLNELPTLNADDWWDHYENEQLRDDLNYEIIGRVNKATIIEAARRHPELVRQWTVEKEAERVSSYDFSNDPKGVWQWDPVTQSYTQRHPLQLSPPQSDEDFFAVIEMVINQFRLFIEEQGGWSLLWDTTHTDEKPEHAAQLLFRGIAQHYCKANNISLDAEVNLGRGPVDFKFSNGYTRRAHLEVKKLHNGKFWNGLQEQLPSYMRSDEVVDGWFLAIQYRSNKAATQRARALPREVASFSEISNLNLRYALVDARPKVSASNL